MNVITIYWFAFIVTFVVVYIIDLVATSRRKNAMSLKLSLSLIGVWISIALIFGISLYFFFPQNPESTAHTGFEMMAKFIAGYFTEYSLSIDNLFVFILIFSMMKIHPDNQPKLLKLGILISIILRISFILVGMELVERFHWIMYIFGIILIWTSYKMVFAKEEESVNPESNILYRAASKIFPIDPNLDSSHFFTRKEGKFHVTHLFMALLVIGSTDILFAIDSIPAIIGVIKEGTTHVLSLREENFIAISSNLFAVMGLISLFFALKGIMGMFRYLKVGVSAILFFIGGKMLLGSVPVVNKFFTGHSWVSLTVIVGILMLSILLSVLISENKSGLKSDLQKKTNKRTRI